MKYINESIQTSNALATSVKKSTAESILILKRLSQSRNELTDAMKDTENTIGFIAGYKSETTDQGKKLLEDLEGISDVAYEVRQYVDARIRYSILQPLTIFYQTPRVTNPAGCQGSRIS